MDYAQCLRDGSVKLDLEGETKDAIVTELADLLFEEKKIKAKAPIVAAVMSREKQMSTGMQYGVAIPHGRTDAVEGIVTAVALKPDGVDFASLDGKPTRIFIMTLSSALQAGSHIEFLAEISRALMRPSVRKRLLKARTKEDVLSILTGTQ